MPRSAPSPLARVRRICLSLPETTERPSHGAPSFFIRDKIGFVNYMDDHHDDGRLALWCACPRGMREGLLKAEPEQYFVPPYVGFRGVDRRPFGSRPGLGCGGARHRKRVSHRRAEETGCDLPPYLTVSYP